MSSIAPEDFFKTQRETSEIKSEILDKYFKAWCGILLFGQRYRTVERLLYIDLYAGRGYYDDNSPSTPVKILESIHKSKGTTIDLDAAVQTFFNDSNRTVINALKDNIETLSFYNELTHKPIILNQRANKELLAELLNVDGSYPSLTFLDPFGYSFSKEMLMKAVQEWGSDLFFLFNINRVRAAVVNGAVDQVISDIFGEKHTGIKDFYDHERNPGKREKFIINQIETLFREQNFLTFKFQINFPNRNQTSHFLFFVTKVRVAHNKMKDIMKKYSEYQPDGVPLFRANYTQTPLFFPECAEFSIYKLKIDLLDSISEYYNQPIESVYEDHNIGTNYIKANYKQAFQELYAEEKIQLIGKNGNLARRITYTCTIQANGTV